MTIAELIKVQRKQLGLKQRDITNAMGWSSPQYQSNIERSISTPPLKSVKKYCEVLMIKPEKLKRLMIKQKRAEIERVFG